jgi:hypothetical protein
MVSGPRICLPLNTDTSSFLRRSILIKEIQGQNPNNSCHSFKMASTKASRKAKRESYGKGYDSDNGSIIAKARKARKSKEAITSGAAKKSDAKARQTREYVLNAKSQKGKPAAQNGRQPGRQLIRWNGK